MHPRLALAAPPPGLAAAAAAPPAPTNAHEETRKAREGGMFEPTRARVRVPESRARPVGPVIALAVVRIRRGEGDLPAGVTLPPLRLEGLPPARS